MTLIVSSWGDVSAGFPSPAQGYEERPLDLNELLVRHPAATFFFDLSGDLPEEGIRGGSILVVDRSITPTPRRLVVADVAGERVVGRLDRLCGEIVCWGVVTAVVTRF